MPYTFRHSTCNEAFEKWSFADTCKAVRKAGYTGIEIAPFTLAEDPACITAAERRGYRSAMAGVILSYGCVRTFASSTRAALYRYARNGKICAIRISSWSGNLLFYFTVQQVSLPRNREDGFTAPQRRRTLSDFA